MYINGRSTRSTPRGPLSCNFLICPEVGRLAWPSFCSGFITNLVLFYRVTRVFEEHFEACRELQGTGLGERNPQSMQSFLWVLYIPN